MKKILFALSFVTAIGSAFTTTNNSKPLAGEVDYFSAPGVCSQHPTCKTTNPGLICGIPTYQQGTNCQVPVTSRRP
ncbi:MAG: hypothetical protein ABI687_06205 [Flavitalea sp.]